MIYVIIAVAAINVASLLGWAYKLGGYDATMLSLSAVGSMISLLTLNNHILRKL